MRKATRHPAGVFGGAFPAACLLATLIAGGCATVEEPAASARARGGDPGVVYLIPKDPNLLNLRSLRFVKLPLPAYSQPMPGNRETGLSNSVLPDGTTILVDRFNSFPTEKGQARSGVLYRVRQDVSETGESYRVALRPLSMRAYGGTPFITPPTPEFGERELFRHLASAVFSYRMELATPCSAESLRANFRRLAEAAAPLGDAGEPAEGKRAVARFSLQQDETRVGVALEAHPSEGGSRAVLRLSIPSYLTDPNTVDLAKILERLRARLVRIANA